jgi:hypothetical protein
VPAGSARRTQALQEVLHQIGTAVSRDPAAAHRALWAAGPRTRVDAGLGVPQAVSLARALGASGQAGGWTTLPVRHRDGAVPVDLPTPETARALEPFRSPHCGQR